MITFQQNNVYKASVYKDSRPRLYVREGQEVDWILNNVTLQTRLLDQFSN